MSYLAGVGLRCANGKATETAFSFLGQAQKLPFMRAFDTAPLSLAQLRHECVNALRTAAQAAGWQPETWQEIPLFIGSTAYTISAHEYDPELVADWDLNTLARGLAPFGQGVCESYASSCTSAAQALIQAHGAIINGECERALILGIESFNLLSLMHFFSLHLLTDEYRPFAGNGFILGEGVAALALDKQLHSGSLKLCAVAANTCATDLAATPSESLITVMREVLQRANKQPEAISAVKVHGVGTQASDAAEDTALTTLFAHNIPRWIFKPQTGHTLGASGAIETALMAQAAAQFVPHSTFLANYFGFGGNNISMVWEKIS